MFNSRKTHIQALLVAAGFVAVLGAAIIEWVWRIMG
jgi:hypothetical protein